MKLTQAHKCDGCGKLYKNLRIRKGKLLCYRCWIKEVLIIRRKDENTR